MKKSSACAGGALLGSYTEGHTIAFLSLASLTGLSHFYLCSKGCAQESKDNRFFFGNAWQARNCKLNKPVRLRQTQSRKLRLPWTSKRGFPTPSGLVYQPGKLFSPLNSTLPNAESPQCPPQKKWEVLPATHVLKNLDSKLFKKKKKTWVTQNLDKRQNCVIHCHQGHGRWVSISASSFPRPYPVGQHTHACCLSPRAILLRLTLRQNVDVSIHLTKV